MAATQAVDGLHGLIHGWNRRSRLRQTLLWLPYSLLPGLGLGILLFLAARLRPLPFTPTQMLLITLLLAVLGLLAMLALVWLRPRPVLRSAQRYDQEFALGERLSTALELIEGRIHSSEAFFSRQIDDALAQGQAVNPREAMPLAWDRRAWIALGIAALAVIVLFLLPNPQSNVEAALPTRSAAIDEAEDAVERITEEIAADTNLTDEERQELLQQLEQTREILEEEDVSAEEAFAALTDTQSELEEQAESINDELRRQQEALDSAAQEFAQQELPQSVSEQPQTGQPGLSEYLEAMQNEENLGESPEDLADNLEAAAEALEEINPDLAEALREAAEALRNGDQQAAQQALQEASEALQQQQQQMQQQQNTAQELQQNAQSLQEASNQVAQQNNSQETQANADSASQEGQQQDGEQSDGQQQSGQTGQTSQQDGENSSSQGQSQQPGEGESGEGQGNAPPQVLGQQQDSSSAGSGAGDQAGLEGDNQGDASGDQPQAAPQNNPDGLGERDFSPIYAPRRPGGEGGPEIFLEPDAGDTPLTEGEFTDNPEGQSLVPYSQVFSEYSNAANRALDADYIPLGLRDVVRDYFGSLEPGQGQ